MGKPTPGPWVTNGTHVSARVGPSQRTVCELSTVAPAKGGRYDAKSHAPELLANARLMAAAPDLLEAAKAVMAALPFTDDEHAALLSLRAAIARTEATDTTEGE